MKPALKILGAVDSEKHKEVVRRLMDSREFFTSQCAEYWASSVGFMKLYLSKRTEYRTDPRDNWMANVFVPDPYKIAEVKASVLTEMFYSADPPIQADAVGDEDYEPSRAVEKLLDYGLRKNRFRRFISSLFRMTSVIGTQLYSLGWTSDRRAVEFEAEPGERDEFQKRLTDVFQGMHIMDPTQVPDWMTDPAAFARWRDEAKRLGTDVPELPSLKQTVNRYTGPRWEMVALTDVLLDPLVGDIYEQPLVFRRLLKPASWLRQKAKEGTYNGAAVEDTVKAASDIQLSKEERKINAFLGIPSGKDDPSAQDRNDPLCELLEFWWPGDEVEYGVVVNRRGIVNTDVSNPYQHGQCSLGLVRNVVIPGRQFGLSDFQAPESLFKEQNILRSLRINRTILETFPVFTRLMEMGMPDLQERMVPGGVIPVFRSDALKTLIEYKPTNAFRDMQLLGQTVDNVSGIGSNVSGGPAEINRVSATDASSRMQSAQVRLKLNAVVAEEELVPSVEQMLWLFAERGGPEMRVRIGGKDPFITVNRRDLLESLEMDYRFIGATRTLKKDLQVQQLMEFLAQNRDRLVPLEHRELMRMIAETLGAKGINRILTAAGNNFAKLQFELMQKATEIKLIELQKTALRMQAPPPPPAVTPDVANDLMMGAQPDSQGAPGPGGPGAPGAGGLPGMGGPNGPAGLGGGIGQP